MYLHTLSVLVGLIENDRGRLCSVNQNLESKIMFSFLVTFYYISCVELCYLCRK